MTRERAVADGALARGNADLRAGALAGAMSNYVEAWLNQLVSR